MPGHGAQEHQTLGDAFNLAGLAAIAAGENLLSQLGGEQAYATEIQLDFEYGTAFWVAYGLHVVDRRWRIALGITVGQAGEAGEVPSSAEYEASRSRARLWSARC